MAAHNRSEMSSKSSSSGVRFQGEHVSHVNSEYAEDKECSVHHTASARSSADSASPSKSSAKRVSQSLAGDFIRAKTVDVQPVPHNGYCACPKLIQTLRKKNYVNNAMVVVVLLDAYCNAASIDARAAGHTTPLLWQTLSDICLFLYTFELGLQFYLDGSAILWRGLVIVDIVVVTAGYVEILLDLLSPDNEYVKVGVLSVLRLARVVRLLKLLRKVKALRELQKLVKMMQTCIKALFWSFIFCFVVMTIWAMLIVEMVDPYMKDMVGLGMFDDCELCQTATNSVMQANLLLFKTVIAGDSWGQIAVPVILRHPETSVIFVGSLLTLVFGVLNLIVAVVVDTFADARERDILNLAEELEQDVAADKKFLQKIFDRIDKDGTGQLSLEQLVQGARQDAEFQSRLRIMDIDEMDLLELFQMIDTDGSGTIEAPEFIKPLSRWVHDSKTAPRFIKYNLLRTMHQQEDLSNMCDMHFQNLYSKIDGIALSVDRISMQRGPPTTTKPFAASWVNQIPFAESAVLSTDNYDMVEQPHTSKKVNLKEVNPSVEGALESAVERLRGLVLEATDLALQYSAADMADILRENLQGNLAQGLSKGGKCTHDLKNFDRRSWRVLSTKTTFESIFSSQDSPRQVSPMEDDWPHEQRMPSLDRAPKLPSTFVAIEEKSEADGTPAAHALNLTQPQPFP